MLINKMYGFITNTNSYIGLIEPPVSDDWAIFLISLLFSVSIISLVKSLLNLRKNFVNEEEDDVIIGDLRISVTNKKSSTSYKKSPTNYGLIYLSYLKSKTTWLNLVLSSLTPGIFSLFFILNTDQRKDVRSHLERYGFKNIILKHCSLEFINDSVYVVNIAFQAQPSQNFFNPDLLQPNMIYHGGAFAFTPNVLEKYSYALKKREKYRRLSSDSLKGYTLTKISYNGYLRNSVAHTIQFDISESTRYRMPTSKNPTNKELAHIISNLSDSQVETLYETMKSQNPVSNRLIPVPFNSRGR